MKIVFFFIVLGLGYCYSDPLGWKHGVGVTLLSSTETLCKNVRDLDKFFFFEVLRLGKG